MLYYLYCSLILYNMNNIQCCNIFNILKYLKHLYIICNRMQKYIKKDWNPDCDLNSWKIHEHSFFYAPLRRRGGTLYIIWSVKHLSQSLYISRVGWSWLVDDPFFRSQWPWMAKWFQLIILKTIYYKVFIFHI